MAECVSCGKSIAAGKFFCDECYVRMKGRKGVLKEVGKAPAGGKAGGAPAAAPPRETLTTPAKPPVSASTEAEARVRGTLTPATHKKVVFIKPTVQKTERERVEKKRFTVTITFSERTYAALSRLKGGMRRKGKAAEGEGAEAAPEAVRPGRGARTARFKGKPRLQAVNAKPEAEARRKGGMLGLIAYRERRWDRGDYVSASMASFAALMIVVLSQLSWARVTLGYGEGAAAQAVGVKGTDLGAWTYICIALGALAFAYMLASLLFKQPFRVVDYGAVLVAAGVLFIPLFYVAIASNSRMLAAAMARAGMAGGEAPAQYERQTLWPAYLMVLMGTLLAFSGLLRLSERKGAGGESGS